MASLAMLVGIFRMANFSHWWSLRTMMSFATLSKFPRAWARRSNNLTWPTVTVTSSTGAGASGSGASELLEELSEEPLEELELSELTV